MVNFDIFWGLTSVLKFHIFLIFQLLRIGTYSCHLRRTGSIFLRCEELVLNFHKCEELVPVLHTCEELVLNFYKCEESVPVLHTCEESVFNFH